MRIQTRSSSYRCKLRIINHLALKKGQNGIFEKQDHYPLYKTHIRKENYQSLRNENGQKVIYEKQEQNHPYKTHIRKETEKSRKKHERKTFEKQDLNHP